MKRLCVIVAIGILSATSAFSQDGLRISDRIPIETGEAFSASKLVLREDTRGLASGMLQAYASAPSPKALAASPDGLVVYGVWPTRSRNQRNESDVRRMALQHCQYRAGQPCELVSVDGLSVKLARPIDALPSVSAFEPSRMPFWSAASVAASESLRAYIAAPSPKALAISPADEARIEWSAQNTMAAAKETALSKCAERARRSGVTCVILAEDESFVLSSVTADRRMVSGAPIRAKDIVLVVVTAYDCPPCGFWHRQVSPWVKSQPESALIQVRDVRAGTYKNTRNLAEWPDDLVWIANSDQANRGTPRFIVLAEGKVVLNRRGLDSFNSEIWPTIQRLTKQSPS